jgi:hypothetical protein
VIDLHDVLVHEVGGQLRLADEMRTNASSRE